MPDLYHAKGDPKSSAYQLEQERYINKGINDAVAAQTAIDNHEAAADPHTQYVPASKGVTNGDSHNHEGGDGAQINYESLSDKPTLGDSSSKNVGTEAGTVAAGDHNHDSTYLAIPGAWTAWNPTVTNLTKGTATIKGAYQQIGKTVHARYKIILAADTSTSGIWYFPFPVAPHADYAANEAIGSAFMRDDTGPARLEGTVVVASSTTFVIYADSSTTSISGIPGVNNTIPWTWATLDSLSFVITYEAA